MLIVADDPSEVWAIGSMLKNGFEVVAATSGIDGFHQLERSSFDCLVLDSEIEEVGLLTFLSYCHRYFPGTKVIVVTGSNPPTVREIPFLANEQRLPRPVNPEALFALISGLAAGGRTLDNPLNRPQQQEEQICSRPY